MDRIFKEEGVIHDDSMSEDDEVKDDADCHKDGDEVIGHMQSKDGENLGELIVPSKSINKLKIKNKRVMGKLCDGLYKFFYIIFYTFSKYNLHINNYFL